MEECSPLTVGRMSWGGGEFRIDDLPAAVEERRKNVRATSLTCGRDHPTLGVTSTPALSEVGVGVTAKRGRWRCRVGTFALWIAVVVCIVGFWRVLRRQNADELD
jgi:hypothetical protein